MYEFFRALFLSDFPFHKGIYGDNQQPSGQGNNSLKQICPNDNSPFYPGKDEQNFSITPGFRQFNSTDRELYVIVINMKFYWREGKALVT